MKLATNIEVYKALEAVLPELMKLDDPKAQDKVGLALRGFYQAQVSAALEASPPHQFNHQPFDRTLTPGQRSSAFPSDDAEERAHECDPD